MQRKMINHIAKGKRVFIGLEDSKKSWKINVRCEGMEIHRATMEAKYSTLRQYLQNKYPECEISVIYEAGFKGFGLYRMLTEDGYQCVVIPPNKVTQEKNNKVKTDKIDARRLAVVLENGDYKACSVPDLQREQDRQYSRTMVQIQKDLTRYKNYIMKLFDFHGYAEFFGAVEWTEQQYTQARTMELPKALRDTVDNYFRIIDTLKEQRKYIHKQLMLLAREERYKNAVKIFTSFCGIGKLTAIRLILEWGEDIGERFRSGNSLACFAGLTQSEYSTGETVRRGRITRQGRGCIRGWLIQCAWVCIKRDPVMMEAYMRITKNTGSKKKAIVAIARKMVVRIWTCLHNNTPYCVGVLE